MASRFRYSLAPGSRVYRCGPAIRRKGSGKMVYRLLAAFIWAGIAFSIMLLYLAFTLPNIEHIANQTRSPSITILDRNGDKVASINDTFGETIRAEELSPHVWQAVVAIEDKRFFGHFGIDPRGFARAVWRNVRPWAGRLEGGSTITQQLAKNVFLSPRRTLARKIQEMMITLWLESKFSKWQILSLYLNRVSLVSGKYGLGSAADELFGKRPSELSVAEAAILAAMLKAPARYSPALNPGASRARAAIVLGQMLDQGYITGPQYESALAYEYLRPERNYAQTRYFVDYVLDELSSRVGGVSSDITIHSTLDVKIQRTAENIAKSYAEKEGAKYRFSQVASVVMGTDGRVLAMVGGRDYAKSQFNRSTQMRRQPGSAFKPFVYLAALGAGMLPDDMFDDRITEIAGWAPRNHDNRYLGPMTMKDALEKSVNTIPVQIARKIGLKAIVASANRLGLVDRMSSDYTIILGTSETTLIDLTAAYAAFANRGFGVIPHGISRIVDGAGRTIYERSGSGVGRLVSESESAGMNMMLRHVIEGGTGAGARIPGADVRGKTGTSQNNRDAWFVGYTDRYVMGVWLGNDDNSPMDSASYGGTIPARIFKAMMTYVLALD